MSILCISGSVRHNSHTFSFLNLLSDSFKGYDIRLFNLCSLPLFHPNAYDFVIHKEVLTFKETIKSHDAIIIATPEYIHNIPAVLKNALEWTTQTGEFSNKKTLAISYTPHPPRGKYAMSSLINSLNALDANVVASLDLYHDSVKGNHFNFDTTELLKEALKLLE